MVTPFRRVRTVLALIVGASLGAVSTAVPLLDAGIEPGPAFSTEEGGQPYGTHDHRICQLHCATAWSAPTPATAVPESFVREARIPAEAAFRADLLLLATNPARAPPTT